VTLKSGQKNCSVTFAKLARSLASTIRWSEKIAYVYETYIRAQQEFANYARFKNRSQLVLTCASKRLKRLVQNAKRFVLV
jgi:hypothetical protein